MSRARSPERAATRRKPGAGGAEHAARSVEALLEGVPPVPPGDHAAAVALAERAPRPARVGSVVTGTAGWTDPTLLVSGFYPPSARSAGARLEHYAAHFSLVEVDATYYALLPPSSATGWIAHTPPEFRFDIKAFPVLTDHPLEVSRFPADLRQAALAAGLPDGRVPQARFPAALLHELEARFRALVTALHAAGRLGAVLLQFSPSWSATRGNARALRETAERWSGIPLAVEFRHGSWLAPERQARVVELVRGCGATLVCADEPQAGARGVPPVLEVTSEALVVLRFHGHNQAGWERRRATVHQRFDWLYSEAELRAWAPRVRAVAQRAERVHAIFNNCVRDYAVQNARGLAAVLAESAS